MLQEDTRVSVLLTTYNSREIVNDAIAPLLQLPPNYEVVIVDNKSTDGTLEELMKYAPRIKVISKRCTRGKGKNIAMLNSTGEILVFIDFDVAYYDIHETLIRNLEYIDKKIVVISSMDKECNAPILIVKRELYEFVEGFPDLNNGEDSYFYHVAEALDLIFFERSIFHHKCLHISGISSGRESRYEKTFFKRFKRRLFATRDILFSMRLNFSQLTVWYNLHGTKKIFIGAPLYFFGAILKLTLDVEPAEYKINRLKNKKS